MPNGKIPLGTTAPIAGMYGRDFAPIRMASPSKSDVDGYLAYFSSRSDFGVTYNYAQPRYTTGDGLQNVPGGTTYRLSATFADMYVNLAAADAVSNAIIKY